MYASGVRGTGGPCSEIEYLANERESSTRLVSPVVASHVAGGSERAIVDTRPCRRRGRCPNLLPADVPSCLNETLIAAHLVSGDAARVTGVSFV
jgi:hypothetical protein